MNTEKKVKIQLHFDEKQLYFFCVYINFIRLLSNKVSFCRYFGLDLSSKYKVVGEQR